ncbi:MAG: sulfite exporter TauE/SafE family protein, partial [Bacteroidetes bacterium]|nr:sulfite exporter TauE/SafE family protein [Bacteroidota bacterium]
MEYFVICLVAFIGSGLTFFSGFGLGTLLLPVFGIFFPIELAIALTAIVHFLNNLFKLALVGNKAHKQTLLSFGIPSVVAAFAGAYALRYLSNLEPLFEYQMMDHHFAVLPIKFC